MTSDTSIKQAGWLHATHLKNHIPSKVVHCHITVIDCYYNKTANEIICMRLKFHLNESKSYIRQFLVKENTDFIEVFSDPD